MDIIFFGSDDFAAAHLETLIERKFSIIGCVTQPDRPKGRGMHVEFSPVKAVALKHDIPVLQPQNLNDNHFIQELEKLAAELFVVIAYGRILTSQILQIPKLYAINVHGSLLPKYRGAAPINWVIINGEKETGITIIKLNARMDAGDIISQVRVGIETDCDAVTLRKKMIEIGKNHLVETLQLVQNGKVGFRKQNDTEVTLAPKLTKELGLINWKKSNVEIYNLIRGLLPWPTAYTIFNGKLLKILKSKVLDEATHASPGQVIRIAKDGMVIATGKGSLAVTEVQPESSTRMSAHAFAIGHNLKEGTSF